MPKSIPCLSSVQLLCNLCNSTHPFGRLKLENFSSPVSGSPQGKERSPGLLDNVILPVCLSATFVSLKC